jgi:hypothetical protein
MYGFRRLSEGVQSKWPEVSLPGTFGPTYGPMHEVAPLASEDDLHLPSTLTMSRVPNRMSGPIQPDHQRRQGQEPGRKLKSSLATRWAPTLARLSQQ